MSTYMCVLAVQLCLTLCDPMDCIHQAALSTEFSRQEYWNGLPFPSPGDLPDSGIKFRSPALQADSLPSEPPRKTKILNYSHLLNPHLHPRGNLGDCHQTHPLGIFPNHLLFSVLRILQ